MGEKVGSGGKDREYTKLTVTNDILVGLQLTASDILSRNLRNGLFEITIYGSRDKRFQVLESVIPKMLGGVRRRSLL